MAGSVTVMAPAAFSGKLAEGDGFARSVAEGAKIWLVGSDDDFAELVPHRKA